MSDNNIKTGISVIIPTLNAGSGFSALLKKLRSQREAPDEIIVIDSSSADRTVSQAEDFSCRVEIIKPSEFNHGRTRNQAAKLAKGDILVFMTQDVMPADENFLSELVKPIRQGQAVCVCARQMAAEYAQPTESFTRNFNYPERSEIRSIDDVKRLGYKAFFISNAAAAYQKKAFEAVEGFDNDLIMCEDVAISSKLLAAGGKLAYQASARVWHTHNYSLKATFKRYFDIGVFMNQAAGRLGGAKVAGQGFKLTKRMFGQLWSKGRPFWAIFSIVESAVKYFALRMGKMHKFIPVPLKRRLSMHSRFWN